MSDKLPEKLDLSNDLDWESVKKKHSITSTGGLGIPDTIVSLTPAKVTVPSESSTSVKLYRTFQNHIVQSAQHPRVHFPRECT